MTRRWAAFWSLWRESDFAFRTIVSALGACAFTTLFALYNGFVGWREGSLWHGSICVYYLFLAALRGRILHLERRRTGMRGYARRLYLRRVATASSIALLALNLTLVVPISMMARFMRPVSMGLIPSLAAAVHATIKIILAIRNYRAGRQSRDLLVRELRAISLIDALVSVLTLQNTLIMVNMEGDGRAMLGLTAVSSAAIFLAIIAISALNLKG